MPGFWPSKGFVEISLTDMIVGDKMRWKWQKESRIRRPYEVTMRRPHVRRGYFEALALREGRVGCEDMRAKASYTCIGETEENCARERVSNGHLTPAQAASSGLMFCSDQHGSPSTDACSTLGSTV